MESGWLLRDGDVLASTAREQGWRARIITSHSFNDGVGAVVVSGPALCVGVRVARLGDASRLRHVASPRFPRVVAPARHALAVKKEVAAQLRVGDELELRLVS